MCKRKLKDCPSLICVHPSNVCIRDVAKAVGYMVSSLPVGPFGGIYYRKLENEKINALKSANGNFDATMAVTAPALEELKWWQNNVDKSYGFIGISPPKVTSTLMLHPSVGGGSIKQCYHKWKVVPFGTFVLY